MNQIASFAVLKKVYAFYLKELPTNVLQEEALNGRLWDALEDRKIRTSDDEENLKVMLQCDVVLAQLRQY